MSALKDNIDVLKDSKDPEIIAQLEELANKVKENQAKKPIEVDVITPFDLKRKKILAISFFVSIALSIISFMFITYMFGFSLGLCLTTFSLLAYEWIDEIYFKENTIRKLGENAIALAIFFFALIILFNHSLDFGDRWIGGATNYSIEENRVESSPVQSINAETRESNAVDSTPPPIRIELRGGSRNPSLK